MPTAKTDAISATGKATPGASAPRLAKMAMAMKGAVKATSPCEN